MNEQATKLLDLVVQELIKQIQAGGVAAATLEVARKIASDAGVTLSTIRSGTLGVEAQAALAKVEEDYPFDEFDDNAQRQH
jgi:hypothetical protein